MHELFKQKTCFLAVVTYTLQNITRKNLSKPVEVYFNWKVLKWKKFCWNLLHDSPQIVKWAGCIKRRKIGKNNTKTLIQSNRYKVPSIDSIYLQYSPKNQRTVGKKTENRYPTGSIQQSGGNIFRKWLSDQGKFSAIRGGQKLQNS